MTIATQVNKVLYSGTGAMVYPYTFKIFKDSDLVVIRRAASGTETTLALTADYTVTGVGSDTGGNIFLAGTQAASPPANGEKLLVKRMVPLTQSTDWVENDDFPAQIIEDAMDRVVCIAQQLQEQLDRAVVAQPTDGIVPTMAGITSAQREAQASAADALMYRNAAALSAAAAATFDPAQYLRSAAAGQPGGVAALDGSGKVPAAQLPATGAQKWTVLTAGADFSTMAASTSAITMVTDQRVVITPGTPVRFTLSGTVYYGICTGITANLLTIAGAPLTTAAGALTDLAWGLLPPIVWPGSDSGTINGMFATAANAQMLADYLLQAVKWSFPKAHCVRFSHRATSADSGASQPRVTLKVAGNSVCAANSGAGLPVSAAGWVDTTVDISPAYATITFGDALELAVDANGANKDAKNLSYQAIFVLE